MPHYSRDQVPLALGNQAGDQRQVIEAAVAELRQLQAALTTASQRAAEAEHSNNALAVAFGERLATGRLRRQLAVVFAVWRALCGWQKAQRGQILAAGSPARRAGQQVHSDAGAMHVPDLGDIAGLGSPRRQVLTAQLAEETEARREATAALAVAQAEQRALTSELEAIRGQITAMSPTSRAASSVRSGSAASEAGSEDAGGGTASGRCGRPGEGSSIPGPLPLRLGCSHRCSL